MWFLASVLRIHIQTRHANSRSERRLWPECQPTRGCVPFGLTSHETAAENRRVSLFRWKRGGQETERRGLVEKLVGEQADRRSTTVSEDDFSQFWSLFGIRGCFFERNFKAGCLFLFRLGFCKGWIRSTKKKKKKNWSSKASSFVQRYSNDYYESRANWFLNSDPCLSQVHASRNDRRRSDRFCCNANCANYILRLQWRAELKCNDNEKNRR